MGNSPPSDPPPPDFPPPPRDPPPRSGTGGTPEKKSGRQMPAMPKTSKQLSIDTFQISICALINKYISIYADWTKYRE